MSRTRLYIRTHGSLINTKNFTSTVPQPRCSTCNGTDTTTDCAAEGSKRHTFKKIYNTVRVPGSLYTHDKGSLSVGNTGSTPKSTTSGASQASDRAVAAVSPFAIPRSKTRLRPGSLAPGGTGVDVKHNSYARYLARKKGGVSGILKQQSCQTVDSSAVVNNKPRKYNVVSGCTCGA